VSRPRAGRARILGAVALLWAGCAAGTRYRVLSTLFDGVPPPAPAPAPAPPAAAGAAPAPASGGTAHEPYAARQCDACHDARAANGLVAPRDRLCFECHDPVPERAFVHGPLVAGGCLLCHDPHSSPYPRLLLDAAAGSCLDCHERGDLVPVPGHEAERGDCTGCHDAHASDRRFLLRSP
jgi:predicted CXXCH cytochrome family protein